MRSLPAETASGAADAGRAPRHRRPPEQASQDVMPRGGGRLGGPHCVQEGSQGQRGRPAACVGHDREVFVVVADDHVPRRVPLALDAQRVQRGLGQGDPLLGWRPGCNVVHAYSTLSFGAAAMPPMRGISMHPQHTCQSCHATEAQQDSGLCAGTCHDMALPLPSPVSCRTWPRRVNA